MKDFEKFIDDKEIKMTSKDLCDLINKWRVEDGKKQKEHKEFMRDIRKEMKSLE